MTSQDVILRSRRYAMERQCREDHITPEEFEATYVLVPFYLDHDGQPCSLPLAMPQPDGSTRWADTGDPGWQAYEIQALPYLKYRRIDATNSLELHLPLDRYYYVIEIQETADVPDERFRQRRQALNKL